jgi:predicted phage tail protein
MTRIKGKGGDSPHTPVTAPNTIRSKTTARVLFATTAGEAGGLVDQVNPLKSVLFDNTPVQNSDGTFNFTDVTVSERYGLPSQSYMPGYPSASNGVAIGSKVLQSTPIVHDTLVAYIDAVRVTVRFPALYEQQDNGDQTGSTVRFQIDRRLGNTGAWTTIHDITKSEKCTGPSDLDYLVQRPGSTGAWQVRLVRVTADNASLTKANDIYFQTATDIQNVQLPYNNLAYLGLTVSADATGASYPRVAFDTYGMKVRVPSNYNVTTRIYTGVWNGLWSSTRVVSDNPAFCLYEVLTNQKWGMRLADSDIDQYSFYSAAVECDALVPNGKGGTEPRYTFNYQFMNEMDGWTFISEMAASFKAAVYTSGNRVRLIQDRPTSYSRLITNSNVIQGDFEYASSQGRNRYTAAVVYWNDPAQGWLSVPAYYEDSTGISRYGYNKTEVAALGATSEGQAYRYAKWLVETSLYNTDTVTFTVGLSNAGMEPGEVVHIMDSAYALVTQEGKVVSSTTNSVTLDKPITVVSGNTIDIVGSDGLTVYTRAITSTGTLSTIFFSGAVISVLPGADFIVTGSVSPRSFKVTNVHEMSQGTYQVSAVQYDPAKFGRVDGTFTLPPQQYQTPPSMAVVPAVTGITFSEESYTTPEGVTRRWLSVKWTPPVNSYVSGYSVFWSKNSGNVTSLGVIEQPYCRFACDTDGVYTVVITAINARGVKSLAASGSTTVNLSTPIGASALNPVTSLFIAGTTGGAFTGQDASITWVDTQTNGAAVVAGYEVRVKRADTSALLRTEFVAVNEEKKYAYTFAKNTADGGPRRSVIFDVYVKDTWGRYSAVTSLTATNATPAAPVITLSAGYDQLFAKVTEAGTAETDIIGCKIWLSTTSGFTPSDATNLVSTGPDRIYSQSAASSSTYYLKAAFYDAFSSTTSSLNVSAQYAVTPVSFTPTAPNEYQVTGLTFKGNNPSTNSVSWTAFTVMKTSGSGIGSTWSVTASNAAWTSGTLYLYWSEGDTTLSSTTTLATAIGSTKRLLATYKGGTVVANGEGNLFIDGANIYAQTIGATQLVAGSAVITGTAQIADAIITDAKIDTLNASKLIAGTVTAGAMETNLFQSNNVLTRGLTVRDASGNIILSSGTNLDYTRVVASSGWLNSNVTLTSNSTTGTVSISGAGGGSVSGVIMPGFTITATNVGTYIGSAAIGYAYVGELKAGNIEAGTFSADNVHTRGLTVRDALGNVILSSGHPLAVGNVSGLGAFATLNQITAANATTYISGAIIDTANIKTAAVKTAAIDNLAVTGAKINDLAVGTLKIADQAVTVPIGANGIAGSMVQGTAETNILSATVVIDYMGNGGGVSVVANASGSLSVQSGSSDTTAGYASIKLYRNGTLLREQTFFASATYSIVAGGKGHIIGSGSDRNAATFVVFDPVGAGTYTYTMTAVVTRGLSGFGPVNFSWTPPGMVIIASKK